MTSAAQRGSESPEATARQVSQPQEERPDMESQKASDVLSQHDDAQDTKCLETSGVAEVFCPLSTLPPANGAENENCRTSKQQNDFSLLVDKAPSSTSAGLEPDTDLDCQAEESSFSGSPVAPLNDKHPPFAEIQRGSNVDEVVAKDWSSPLAVITVEEASEGPMVPGFIYVGSGRKVETSYVSSPFSPPAFGTRQSTASVSSSGDWDVSGSLGSTAAPLRCARCAAMNASATISMEDHGMRPLVNLHHKQSASAIRGEALKRFLPRCLSKFAQNAKQKCASMLSVAFTPS